MARRGCAPYEVNVATGRNNEMKIPSYMQPKYKVLLVASLGGLFAFVNLGSAQNLTPTAAPAAWRWTSIASSADGAKLVAAGYDCLGCGGCCGQGPDTGQPV